MSYPMSSLEAIADSKMSDDAWKREIEIKARYYAAEDAYRAAIAALNKSSGLAKMDAEAFEDFCHDYAPDETSWEQAIEEAYRG